VNPNADLKIKYSLISCATLPDVYKPITPQLHYTDTFIRSQRAKRT